MLENTLQCLIDVAEKYSDLSLSEDNPDTSCIWKNYKFTTDKVRYGHIEYFKAVNDKVEVVHAMLYPSLHIAFPIFGFDAIALNGKVTGVFCDVTATPFDNRQIRVLFEILNERYNDLKRKLPEWANFFSPQFLALSPNENLDNIIFDCIDAMDKYFLFINQSNDFLESKNIEIQKNKQNEYSLHQQKNTKTLKALSAYIGEEKAKNFIETVLFPTTN